MTNLMENDMQATTFRGDVGVHREYGAYMYFLYSIFPFSLVVGEFPAGTVSEQRLEEARHASVNPF